MSHHWSTKTVSLSGVLAFAYDTSIGSDSEMSGKDEGKAAVHVIDELGQGCSSTSSESNAGIQHIRF